MGFDIGRLEIRKHSEAGVDFQLEHPTDGPIVDDKGKPVTINLSGADSSRIKALVRERQKKPAPETPASDQDREDRAREENIEDLVTLTNGWSDNWEWEGKPFPFSKDNAELFFRELPEYAAWATNKVIQRLNFMRGWSKK